MERGLITIFLKRYDDLLKQVYRKILEIYATSINYDPRASVTQLFFQTVQNKLHWATELFYLKYFNILQE